MYLDYYEKRRYMDNLGKQWRSEAKYNEDIVLGSSEGSEIIPALKYLIAFYEAKKVSLANTIKDRIEAIDEAIEFEKGFMKDVQDNPDYCKR